MRGYYESRVSAAMLERLSQLNDQPGSRYSLTGEIDLARIIAGDALEVYDEQVAQSKGDATGKLLARGLLVRSIGTVVSTISQAARIARDVAEVQGTEAVEQYRREACRVIAETLQRLHLPEVAEALAVELSQIKLPQANSSMDRDMFMASIRDDLAAMDSTVPSAPESPLAVLSVNGNGNGKAH